MNFPINRSPVTEGCPPDSQTEWFFPLSRSLVAMVLVFFSLMGVPDTARAVEDGIAIEEGFALRLAAIAPDGGWETLRGRSAASGTAMVFGEINASRKGLHGLEVLVEKVPQPANLKEAREMTSRLLSRDVLAIVCFGSEIPSRYAAQAASESGLPLILCHSETIALGPDPQSPDPFLFGLDLEKSFRPMALAMWAETRKDCSWSIFIDRVDPYLSLQGENTEELLGKKRIDTKAYWFVRSTVEDIVGRLTESIGEKSPWIVSWLSPIMSLRIYSTARRKLFPVKLFHGDIPSDLLRPYDGIFVLDQSAPLRDKELLDTLGDRLWAKWGTTQGGGLTEEAIRAVAAFQWIRKALESLSENTMNPKAVARALEKVPGVQVENLSIPFSPRSHRPRERQVSVLVSKDGSWEEVERLTVPSP